MGIRALKQFQQLQVFDLPSSASKHAMVEALKKVKRKPMPRMVTCFFMMQRVIPFSREDRRQCSDLFLTKGEIGGCGFFVEKSGFSEGIFFSGVGDGPYRPLRLRVQVRLQVSNHLL